MSDLPPPDPNTAAADGDAAKPDRRWKTWHLAVVGVLALLIGIGMGAGGETETDGDPVAAEPAPTVTVTVTVTPESIAPPAEPEETEEAADREPVEETEAVAQPAEQGDTVTAGDFTFEDIQVSEDYSGDFQVRTRATNNGSNAESVGIKATIFSGGSVVGTAQGAINDWPAGETRTVELISLDDYQDWDEVEFQIEYQF